MSLQAEHLFPCHKVFHYETISKFTFRNGIGVVSSLGLLQIVLLRIF